MQRPLGSILGTKKGGRRRGKDKRGEGVRIGGVCGVS